MGWSQLDWHHWCKLTFSIYVLADDALLELCPQELLDVTLQFYFVLRFYYLFILAVNTPGDLIQEKHLSLQTDGLCFYFQKTKIFCAFKVLLQACLSNSN